MSWGYHEWLLDRDARRQWMRSVALVDLAEQILRTPASGEEALGCLLDEISGGEALVPLPELRSLVDADLASAGRWTRAAFEGSRAGGVTFQSLAVLIPDGAPYDLELAFVNGQVTPDTDWTDQIVWRFPEELKLRALGALLDVLGTRAATMQREGDYILPLGYAAFLMRDVVRGLGAEDRRSLTTMIVSYYGGDSLAVPLES